jgi:hypothetical protein
MTPNTQQRIASIARQVASIAMIVLALIPQVPLPGAWSRVAMVLIGGILQIAEHVVADPSTGTPPAPEGATVPDPAPAPVAPVVGPSRSVGTEIASPIRSVEATALMQQGIIPQPSPAPVPPPEWSTMAASSPQAQTTPNPAPPAPTA